MRARKAILVLVALLALAAGVATASAAGGSSHDLSHPLGHTG